MRKTRSRRTVKRRKEENNPFFGTKENQSKESSSKPSFFQAKLEIGDPADMAEKEADAVAEKVVNHPKTSSQKTAFESNAVQRQAEKEEEPAAKQIRRQAEKEEEPAAKLIQKQEEQEEEPAAKHIQRQAEKEEEPAAKLIQRQGEKEEEPAAKLIQRQAEKEEEPAAKLIQKQEEEEEPAAKRIQRQTEEEEEEEPVQAKLNNANSSSPIQTKSGEQQSKPKGGDAKAQLEQMIKDTKGMGMALPDDIRSEMESEFKTDFSKVRIHTGDKAVEMTTLIQAQAFTHGYDIYFNEGKYQPYATEGKLLLAHELTHVVQQKG